MVTAYDREQVTHKQNPTEKEGGGRRG